MRSIYLLVCVSMACSSNESSFVAKARSDGTGGTGGGGTGAFFGRGGAMGCETDLDCKGVGVCEKGECVEPSLSGGTTGQGGATGGRSTTDASAAGTSGGGNEGGPAAGGNGGSGGGGATNTGGSGGTSGDGATGNLRPLAMFIMQDRSGSMVTGFPTPASPESWNNSTQAITAFVQDPQTAGIDIGLGTFPVGANNTASCTDGSDCGTPVVPIASLPGNGAAMIQAMQQQTPTPTATTPTECALRGMINTCQVFMSSSPAGEKCVAVLITDGSPTLCDTNLANLAQIVTDGRSNGVSTFTLGLPGSDLTFLNSLATAGGTRSAIDVSGGAQAFVAALNSVRSQGTNACSTNCEKKCGGACVQNGPGNGCSYASCTPCAIPANGFSTCTGSQCDFGCRSGFRKSGTSCIAEPPNDGGTVTCNGQTCTNTCAMGNPCCNGTSCGCMLFGSCL